MSKSSYLEQGFLNLIFNATPIANLADNAASSPLTNLYLSLHTADPGVGGNQTTSEIAYTGYARAAVARTTGGFNVASGSGPATVTPAATVSFPAGTGGSGTATFAAIGTASSGAGHILYSGALTPSIVCGNGVTPQLTSASAITEL